MSSSTKAGEIKDVNLRLCIICDQIKPNERLMEHPSSHDKVLMCIQELVSYGPFRIF